MTDHPDYFVAERIEVAELVGPDRAGVAIGMCTADLVATRWLLSYDRARALRDALDSTLGIHG